MTAVATVLATFTLVGLIIAAIAQTPPTPFIALGDGTPVAIRSFDMGTSDAVPNPHGQAARSGVVV